MLCVHSSTDGHLGCFHFLAILNNAAMTIRVYLFVWTYVYKQGNTRKYTEKAAL